MTTKDFIKAKFTIVRACNSLELDPGDLVGVLSAVLDEAREQMCLDLFMEVMDDEKIIEKLKKEEEDGSG